ncbi:MAG: tetratricopeptide repeat protein [Treponematales bacterium]
MAEHPEMPPEGKQEGSVPERLNEFIRSHRGGLAVGLVAVLVLIAGFVVGLFVRDTMNSRALAAVAEYNRRYEELRLNLGDDAKAGEIEAFLDELAAFAGKRSGFAAARAHIIAAGIHSERENWDGAEQAWAAAALAVKDSYLAPLAFFNAAAAAEEAGNLDAAVTHYRECLAKSGKFPSPARAQFALGRIEEARDRKDAAIEAYRTLVSKWPDDHVWTNLAQSRLIILEAP